MGSKLYRAGLAAVNRLASRCAGAVSGSERRIQLLRRLPIPGKRRIVAHLDLPPPASPLISKCGGFNFCLDLTDHLDRLVYFNSYENSDRKAALGQVPRGGVCLDVGANMGFYAVPLARRVGPEGKVHVFEPDRANIGRLERNLSLNGLAGNVITNRCALSDRVGTAVFHSPRGQSSYGTLAAYGTSWDRNETVPTDTLDRYLDSHGVQWVDFAKIDVEGHEFEVLEGAAGALSRRAIGAVLIEYNGGRLAEVGHSLEDLLGLLEAHGYRPVELNQRLLTLLKKGYLPPRQVCINLLFKPIGPSVR